MKFKYSALLAAFSVSAVHASDIVITGVVDATLKGGTPKAIEIFVVNDIADLSACGVGSANNGGGSDGQEINFSLGTATAGTYIYVASEATKFAEFFGFAPDYTGSGAAINGDDAVELFCNGVVVDVFGDINVDGNGEAWEYQNGWAARVAGTGPDGSNFKLNSWTFSGVNALNGQTTNASATTPYPLKSYADEVGGGGGGGGGGEDEGVCTNCPDVPKVADASTFSDSEYYASVITEVAASADASFIKMAITDVISENFNSLSYTQAWTVLTESDQDPVNADNIILLYSGKSIPKNENASGDFANEDDFWNREHVWPNSHGFADDGDRNQPPELEGFSDVHHLRPTDRSINTSRGNLDFDESDGPLAEAPENSVDNDSFEPRDEVKGDVARMMFYMDTRYEGIGDDTPNLVLVDELTSSGEPRLGKLCTLLAWHADDPVSEFEENRNNVLYEYQGNRNPYVDHPEWVELIYPADACSGDDGGEGEGEGDNPVSSSDIVISGVIDGPLSGGIPKAVELYVVNDIEDLSVCGVGFAQNGGGTDGQEFTFEVVSAEAGDFIYVASETDGFNAFFGFEPDYVSGAAGINGDDSIELFCNDEVVDTFGEIDVDGSNQPWEYKDGWAYRVANTGPDGTAFVLDNWTFSGKDALDGTSTNASANPAFPVGTFFVAEKLIISGVVDASLPGGLPKAVEFYAVTDIQDLSVFGFGSANNGGGSDGEEYTFSGSASSGDYIYIASEDDNFEAFFGFPPTAIAGASNINGDDAIELFKNGVVVDVFGDINTDGSGEPWDYQDGWAYRKSSTGPDGAIFSIDNWTFSGTNVLDGQSTNDSAPTPFPTGSFSGSGGGGGGGGGGPGVCCDEVTFIHAVQGSGDASPLVGETVLIEGIVSASFADASGFFIQEESADMDANPSTSEGVFVSYSGELPAVGSLISVIGAVSESFGRTQLTATAAPVIIATETSGVTASLLSLPFVNAAEAESLEGMLVSALQALVVTDNFTLGRFGQVTLSTERLFVPTNVFAPGSDEAIALEASNTLNRILLDDGDSTGNPEVVVFPTGGLSASNTLRLGDTVSALTGVVDFAFSDYRVIPTQDPTFVATNPRTAEPDLNLGNLKVASLNVLNYFNNIDTGNICGPSAESGCRGADSELEFERQKAKTVAAIVTMDADIVGLMEIENNGFSEGSAIEDLVAAINAIMGAGTYSIVDPGAPIGTDAITVALIYKSSVVSLNGAPQILDSSNSISDIDGPLFIDTKNRPSLIQEFALLENGETLVISVNHLKSKGSGCGAGDDDTTTGQGSCNLTRTRAAQALSAFLDAQFPDTATLIIGDLNAYAKEDPISALEGAGYTNLVNYFGGDEAYSYSFRGLLGYLDHALANNKALAKVVDVTEWHINADEPISLDYNVEFKTPDNVTDYYADDAYRMSDHDPVLIALQLDAPAGGAETSADVNQDGSINFSDYFAILGMLGSATGDANFDAIADYDEDGVISPLDLQAWYQLFLGQ